jgi:two-component system nitrogen regulation sensor histidine kinase NtrY
MIFPDRYSLLILTRIILILASCTLFGFLFARSDYLFSQIILFILILIQTFDLIRFSRKMNHELAKFLLAVKYGDVTVNFNMDRLGRDFRSLSSAFRELIHSVQEMKIEKEAQFQLLQSIIDKISFGIIAYREDGEILLMNESSAALLEIPKATHWQYIEEKASEFATHVEEMTGSGRKLIEMDNQEKQFSVVIHFFTIREQVCRLITFHDIRDEIEQKEIEAWYKLIRILTHEIMNSLTPLGSLTDTILMLLEEDGNQKPIEKISEQQVADVRSSVMTIRKRSTGILNFVEDYRKLTHIPHPELEEVLARDLFDGVAHFLNGILKDNHIHLVKEISPEDLRLIVDPNLMEQVLINLVTNAIHASSRAVNKRIELRAWMENSRPRIAVTDYGHGIEHEKMNKIFIPFYSTREGGSGIGLSFSKHVVHLHHGRIKTESIPGEKTTFTLELPQSGG